MKFSIIVPVFNRENTISTCVEELFKTEYRDFEVILVDDGSIDASFHICQELAKKYPNVNCYSQKNGGVSSARNLGIIKAKGDYIMFLDSDDTYLPNTLMELNILLRAGVDFLAFGQDVINYSDLGMKIYARQEYSKGMKILGNTNVIKWVYEGDHPYVNPMHCVCSKVFKSDIIRKYNIKFNEKVSLGEDQIFVCDYLRHVESFLHIEKAYFQNIVWPKNLRPSGLGGCVRTPEDFLHNQKENYNALIRLYQHSGLSCVKEYAVNYLLDRPITRIIFRNSVFCNPNRVSYQELKVFVENRVRPIISVEYENILMLRNKKIANYVRMLMEGNFRQLMLCAYVEQNFKHMIWYPMRIFLSDIKNKLRTLCAFLSEVIREKLSRNIY